MVTVQAASWDRHGHRATLESAPPEPLLEVPVSAQGRSTVSLQDGTGQCLGHRSCPAPHDQGQDLSRASPIPNSGVVKAQASSCHQSRWIRQVPFLLLAFPCVTPSPNCPSSSLQCGSHMHGAWTGCGWVGGAWAGPGQDVAGRGWGLDRLRVWAGSMGMAWTGCG